MTSSAARLVINGAGSSLGLLPAIRRSPWPAGRPRPPYSRRVRAFGTFVETQWKTLVLPTFKRSTQHGYKTVLNLHVLPAWRDWRLRDIERLAIQQWVAEKFRQQCGWQTVRNSWVLLSGILETAVE